MILSDAFRHTPMSKNGSHSQVKYFGDFHKDLRAIIALGEIRIHETFSETYNIESIITGDHDMRIRMVDEFGALKMITVIFRYHHNDEKYGNIHMEIVMARSSEKNKSIFPGKYRIKDKNLILDDIIKILPRLFAE